MGGGDAEVDTIRAVEDVEERRLRNRGKRGGNGRVDAKIDAVKPLERQGATGFARSNNASGTKARDGVANTGCTSESAPTMWLRWTKKKQMRERMRR